MVRDTGQGRGTYDSEVRDKSFRMRREVLAERTIGVLPKGLGVTLLDGGGVRGEGHLDPRHASSRGTGSPQRTQGSSGDPGWTRDIGRCHGSGYVSSVHPS